MKIRYVILPMLMIFILTSGLTLGQSVENSTISTNSTATTSSAEDLTKQAASSENISTSSSVPNLKSIWSITGIEKDPITMALDQSDTDLFGQAKYEPDSGQVWNGVAGGSISGNNVNLVITAQKGNSLESIKLDGVYADDALSGKFTTRDSTGKTISSGDFNAIWTNPDISSYTPAQVATAAPAAQSQATPTVTTSTQISNTSSTTQQTSGGETPEGLQTGPSQRGVKIGGGTKYVDVHEYAEKIGPGGDLSGVPPGMGGSGL